MNDAMKNGSGTRAVKIDKHTLRKFPFEYTRDIFTVVSVP